MLNDNPEKPLINKDIIENVVDEVTLEDEEELTYQKRVEDYESARQAEIDYNNR